MGSKTRKVQVRQPVFVVYDRVVCGNCRTDEKVSGIWEGPSLDPMRLIEVGEIFDHGRTDSDTNYEQGVSLDFANLVQAG